MSDMLGGDIGMLGGDMLVQQAKQRLADGRRMPTVPQNMQNMSLKKAAEVAQDFEAVFTTQMISQMFKDVPIGKFGGGFGEKVWREHLYDEFGKTMAKGSPLGVAHQVLSQILQMQGKKPHEIKDMLNELLPRPETSAVPGRNTVGEREDTVAKAAAESDGKTVLERNRAANAAVKAPVGMTPTMSGIETERAIAPTPKDAMYHKLPDGHETASPPVGLPVPPENAQQASAAPVPLFPASGDASAAANKTAADSGPSAGAAAPSVGKAMLATFKAGNRAATVPSGSAQNGASRSATTGQNAETEPAPADTARTAAAADTAQTVRPGERAAAGADGPPVSLVAALAGRSGTVDQG